MALAMLMRPRRLRTSAGGHFVDLDQLPSENPHQQGAQGLQLAYSRQPIGEPRAETLPGLDLAEGTRCRLHPSPYLSVMLYIVS